LQPDPTAFEADSTPTGHWFSTAETDRRRSRHNDQGRRSAHPARGAPADLRPRPPRRSIRWTALHEERFTIHRKINRHALLVGVLTFRTARRTRATEFDDATAIANPLT